MASTFKQRMREEYQRQETLRWSATQFLHKIDAEVAEIDNGYRESWTTISTPVGLGREVVWNQQQVATITYSNGHVVIQAAGRNSYGSYQVEDEEAIFEELARICGQAKHNMRHSPQDSQAA